MFSNVATPLHTNKRFKMTPPIPLCENAYILMNSEMILRKNAEVQAEFDKVQKQINELMHTRAKLEEMKNAYSAMVEKLPPHRRRAKI